MDLLHRLKNHDAGVDLSMTLRDSTYFKYGALKNLSSQETGPMELTAIALEPASGILAVALSGGLIRLFGASPVVCTLYIPQRRNAKHLAFSASLKKLTCIDASDAMHIWMLDPQEDVPSSPKLIKTYQFRNNVTGIITSPSHSHVFISFEAGDVIAYDLDRRWLTSYAIPNLWSKHEEVLRMSGISPRDTSAPPTVMDMVIHPRDLNRLFIVYEFGVVLWDIAQRTSICTYELILHPGAPGGGSYSEEEIFTERHPASTCLTIHPSGHIFAVGHIDGCISFWAVEDDDRPLTVRTLKDPFSLMDVHVPDPLALTDSENVEVQFAAREPIFRLAWSGFSQRISENESSVASEIHVNSQSDGFGEFNETTLSILGGTTSAEGKGVTVLKFPALRLPETGSIPPSEGQSILQPSVRQALKNSLFLPQILQADPECDTLPTDLQAARFQFLTNDTIEDFFLIPSGSPHFSGTFDPVGIICLSSPINGDRAAHNSILRSFLFPPAFDGTTSARCRLPVALSFDFPSPEDVVLGVQTHKMDSRELFGRLIQGWVNCGDNGQSILGKRLTTLRAGGSWSNFTGEDAPSAKLSKFDYHRLLITHHGDLTLRFFDISPQVLLSDSPLKFEYPQVIPHLTIELHRTLNLIHPKRSTSRDTTNVQSVIFAKFALEVAVVLDSGEVFLYRFKESGSPTQVYDIPIVDNTRIVSLDALLTAADRRKDSFHPFFAVHGDVAATVTACALSDVGFMAIAYDSDSMVIVDLRGPRIIWTDNWSSNDKAKDKMGHVDCMYWTISPGLGDELRHGVHLVLAYHNGMSRIITLDQNTGSKKWEVVGAQSELSEVYKSTGLQNPIFSTVLDSTNGNELLATPTAFQKVMAGDLAEPGSSHGDSSGICHCIWVVASKRGARSFMNISGERVGRAEWPKNMGEALEVRVVNRNGYQVLAIFMNAGKVLIHSLPQLELLHTIDIFPTPPDLKVETRIRINCDSEGDFVKFTPGTRPNIDLETLFHFRRPLPSLVDFGEPPLPPVGPQPKLLPLYHQVQQGVIGTLGSWMWGAEVRGKSGEEIDSIIAGPDRPPPPAPLVRKPVTVTTPGAGKRASGAVDSSQRQDLYSRLHSAAAERGEALSNLEERFAAMESSSRDMVEQAKKVAAQQTAKQGVKRWFSGLGG